VVVVVGTVVVVVVVVVVDVEDVVVVVSPGYVVVVVDVVDVVDVVVEIGCGFVVVVVVFVGAGLGFALTGLGRGLVRLVVSSTEECQATRVPGAGDWRRTTSQVPPALPGPRVVK